VGGLCIWSFFALSNKLDYTNEFTSRDNTFRFSYVYGNERLDFTRHFTFSWQMEPMDRPTENPEPCYPSYRPIDISTEPRGFLTSNANAPKYAPNSFCTWQFTNPYSAAVHLGINGKTQRDDDLLTIVDSVTSKSYKFSNNINADLILQNDFKVTFNSDGVFQYEGFNLTWYADMAVEEIRTSPKVIVEYELAVRNYSSLGEPLNGSFTRVVPLVALKNPAPCYPAQREVDLGVSPAGFVASSLEGPYAVGGACSWKFVSVPMGVVLFLSGELNGDDLVNITFGSQSFSFSGVLDDRVEIPMVDSFTVRFRSFNTTVKPGFTLDWKSSWLEEPSFPSPVTETETNFSMGIAFYGIIAGIVIGFILLTSLVVGLIVFFCVKGKAPSDQSGHYQAMPTDS